MVFLTKWKRVVDMIFYKNKKIKKNDKTVLQKHILYLYLNKKYIVILNKYLYYIYINIIQIYLYYNYILIVNL